MTWPAVLLLPSLVGSIAVVFAHPLRLRLGLPIAAAAAGGTLVAALALAREVAAVGEVAAVLGGWGRPYGVELAAGPGAAFVAVVLAVVALAALAWAPAAAADLGDRETPFAALGLLLLFSLLGLTVAADGFTLYVFLEISSLAGYALFSVGRRRAAVAAFRYLLTGGTAGALYLLGLGHVFVATGTLNLADLAARIAGGAPSPAVVAGSALMAVGLAVKAAVFPLHGWLPDAYSYAHRAVAALAPPLMTKAAAFALWRVGAAVAPAWAEAGLGPALLALSVVGVLWGSVAAVGQRDISRMLAWSSVAQVAMVVGGLAVGTPAAVAAALLHLAAHALAKAGLFMAAGAWRLDGVHTLDDLPGAGAARPWAGAVFTVGALSLVGVPPMAGFFGKWALATSALASGAWPFAAVVVVSSLVTASYMLRAVGALWFGEAADRSPSAHGLAWALPAAALGALVLAAAAWQGPALSFLARAG